QVGTAAAPIDSRLSLLTTRNGVLVHIPLPGSPALDRGQAFGIADERGVTRPATGSDIGAVEAQAFGITSPSGGPHAAGGTAYAPPLKATVTEGGLPLPGAVVTFTAPDGGPGGSFAGDPTVTADAAGVATA